MPRRNTSDRQARRQEQSQRDRAFKLMGLGLVCLLLPLFLGKSPVGAALAWLMPIGMLLVAAAGIFFWLDDRKTQTTDTAASSARPTSWSSAVFDVIEWRRFEALVEAMYKMDGYLTKSQPHGADGGVDVWVYAPEKPDKALSVVQCKHWPGKRVGVDKVRELLGVMTHNNVKRAELATTSSFTDDAKQFAQQNGIHLLDIHGLLELIGKRTAEQQAALLAVALEGEYWRPTCVNCGIKLVKRQPKSGGDAFWGCANYPQCRTTMRIRTQV